jgi:RNA polymerase sigma factor (sigma-70 family)
MEASALTHAPSRRGIFSRPTPLLKLQGDDKLVALTREGNPAAFEALVARYQARLLGFCRQMLRSTEDAEDVLQEVFVAAYNAMVADERKIAVRPWLYRIARNRCLNHLRRPVPDGQDTMDVLPIENGDSVHDRVQNREEFRDLLDDVGKLPETQRSALLLREIDAMSYEEIASSMETTVPGVKSLLVRARIALAESTQARLLTCDEVRLELAEAAEGLAKAGGPVRRHVRECENCKDFRDQLRNDSKALAALFPVPMLFGLKGLILGKLGLGSGGGAAAGGGAVATSGAAGGAAAGGVAATGGATAVGGVGAGAIGGAAAAGGAGAAGAGGGIGAAGALGLGAVGTKVGVGLTSAVLLAGAAEVKHQVDKTPNGQRNAIAKNNDAKVVAAAPVADAPPADPKAPTSADPATTANPAVDVPVDPSAPPTTPATDPSAPALTTGGTIPALRHGRKHRRRGATADSLPAAPAAPAQSPDTSSSGTGEDAPPTDPGTVDDGTDTGTDTGSTTTPLTP